MKNPQIKNYTVKPASSLKGTIQIPGDKSISHRALILASLAEGVSKIRHLLLAQDVLATMRILQQLGVRMSHTPEELQIGDELKIYGEGLHALKGASGILDCGNSGTTLRLMMGLLSAHSFEATLTGDASLNKRPVDRVAKPLEKMGGGFAITYDRKGKRFIKSCNVKKIYGGMGHQLPVASAQVKSAIMLAALYGTESTTIIEPALSRDHTERMMSAMGVHIEREGTTTEIFPPKKMNPIDLTIPGDLSSASFFIVGSLILPGSEIKLTSVGLNPSRSAIIRVLMDMGGKIEIENYRTVAGEISGDLICRASPLTGFNIGGALIPNIIDEIPIFSIAASVAQGTSKVSDASELRVKESDRIKTMVQELSKIGVSIKECDDGFEISGGYPFKEGTYSSQGDHRVAMSMAIAALRAPQPSVIEDVECVNTSFPSFFGILEKLSSKSSG